MAAPDTPSQGQLNVFNELQIEASFMNESKTLSLDNRRMLGDGCRDA